MPSIRALLRPRSTASAASPAALPLALALVAALASPPAPGLAQDGTGGAALPRGPETFDRLEVLLEAGLVEPLGDLGAGFATTDHGMGAELGWSAGVRTRIYLTGRLTVEPSFTYVEIGDYDGINADGSTFFVRPTLLRYGLDLGWVGPGTHGQVRPVAGLGAAVVRNRYHDEAPDDETFYEAGVNNLAWSLRAGVRWQDLELSLQYEFNRFRTGQFAADLRDRDHDWNHLVVRLGYRLPTGG